MMTDPRLALPAPQANNDNAGWQGVTLTFAEAIAVHTLICYIDCMPAGSECRLLKNGLAHLKLRCSSVFDQMVLNLLSD